MTDYAVTVKTFPTGGIENGAPQVGHAFITLSAPGKPDITIGYYPIVHGAFGPGTVRDDTRTGLNRSTNTVEEHSSTWERTFIVSERQYSNMLNYAATVANDTTDNYNGYPGLSTVLLTPLILTPFGRMINSFSNVCTDFARNVLTVGEITPPPIIGRIFDTMLPQEIQLQYGLVSTDQINRHGVRSCIAAATDIR